MPQLKLPQYTHLQNSIEYHPAWQIKFENKVKKIGKTSTELRMPDKEAPKYSRRQRSSLIETGVWNQQ